MGEEACLSPRIGQKYGPDTTLTIFQTVSGRGALRTSRADVIRSCCHLPKQSSKNPTFHLNSSGVHRCSLGYWRRGWTISRRGAHSPSSLQPAPSFNLRDLVRPWRSRCSHVSVLGSVAPGFARRAPVDSEREVT